eukprot:s563_g9.t1
MYLHFVWQAWRLVTWTFTLCGRRGSYGTQLAPVTCLGPVDAARGGIDLHFVWQAWHLVTWTFTLCGRRGTYDTQLAPVTRLGPVDATSLCAADVAFRDIDLQFVWQARHLVTWTFTLCGRRGTYGTQLAPVTRLGPAGVEASTSTLCGRRDTQLAPATRLGPVDAAPSNILRWQAGFAHLDLQSRVLVRDFDGKCRVFPLLVEGELANELKRV